MDLATEEQLARFRHFIEDEKQLPYFEIIAPIAEGTKALIDYTAATLAKLPPVKIYEREEIPAETLAQGRAKRNAFTVTAENGVYYIQGDWLVNILNKTDPDDYESLQYFQRVLRKSGIIDALVEKGIQDGDVVDIYGLEFEYVP